LLTRDSAIAEEPRVSGTLHWRLPAVGLMKYSPSYKVL